MYFSFDQTWSLFSSMSGLFWCSLCLFFLFDSFCSRIFLVFMFFKCLIYFLDLVLFLGYFQVKLRFLIQFMIKQKISRQSNWVDLVRSGKKQLSHRVQYTVQFATFFVKGFQVSRCVQQTLFKPILAVLSLEKMSFFQI